MRHHLSTLAQMYDTDMDFGSLAVFLVFVLIIVLTVVVFVVGVSREARQRFDARKRKINSRPGFPVEIPQDNPPKNLS